MMNSKEILFPRFSRPVPKDPRYPQRLEEEFTLIDKFQFTRVFLQVKTILDIAKDRNIPHIIRGSAGSSLVCFLMGITEIDPILYGLELARFMNHGRSDLPDIDIDVPYNRRDELYEAIQKQWKDKVARISNHVKYGHKTALREAAKVLLKERMPDNPALRSEEEKHLLRRVARRNFRLQKLLTEDEQKAAYQKAKELQGTVRHHSLHCGGIVIFEEEGEIPEDIQLQHTKALPQIRLDKDETEDAGYIKIDILSNRGLAQLIDADPNHWSLLEYPSRDPKTEEVLRSGNNLGLTFGESRGMRKLFIEMRPRHMEDIALALALIRPAAANGGRKAAFLDRWKHVDEDAPIDPLRKPILFDDDALTLIQHALECSPAEADKWRKIFAKQNPRGRFDFRRAMTARGIAAATQHCIVDDLDQLALYSFCKSHAISYAQLVWALAYQKAHHPHEFWIAALNHCHSEYRRWVHWREARCSGLLLTREKGPYRLGKRNGNPAVISTTSQGEQSLLFAKQQSTAEQNIRDVLQHGYWLSVEFLPNCGVWKASQPKITSFFSSSHRTDVRFRGIIATGRVVRRDGVVTLLTIGYDNQKYVDLVIPDTDRGDVLRYAGVEGTGTLQKHGALETITVETIRPVSYKDLLSR